MEATEMINEIIPTRLVTEEFNSWSRLLQVSTGLKRPEIESLVHLVYDKDYKASAMGSCKLRIEAKSAAPTALTTFIYNDAFILSISSDAQTVLASEEESDTNQIVIKPRFIDSIKIKAKVTKIDKSIPKIYID